MRQAKEPHILSSVSSLRVTSHGIKRALFNACMHYCSSKQKHLTIPLGLGTRNYHLGCLSSYLTFFFFGWASKKAEQTMMTHIWINLLTSSNSKVVLPPALTFFMACLHPLLSTLPQTHLHSINRCKYNESEIIIFPINSPRSFYMSQVKRVTFTYVTINKNGNTLLLNIKCRIIWNMAFAHVCGGYLDRVM